MHILITGTAGFIASKVAELLLDEGHTVTGVDNLNDAYDVRLKEWRLARLQARPGFRFQRLDIADRRALRPCFQNSPRTPSSTWPPGPASGPRCKTRGSTWKPT